MAVDSKKVLMTATHLLPLDLNIFVPLEFRPFYFFATKMLLLRRPRWILNANVHIVLGTTILVGDHNYIVQSKIDICRRRHIDYV